MTQTEKVPITTEVGYFAVENLSIFLRTNALNREDSSGDYSCN